MIATLPMSLRAQTRDAHDVLWALIRDALRDHGQAAPDALDRTTPHHLGARGNNPAIRQALSARPPHVADTLLLRAIPRVDAAAYSALPIPPAPPIQAIHAKIA